MSETFDYQNDSLEEYDDQQMISPKARKLKSGIRFARVVILFVMAVTAMLLIFINRDRISMDNFKRLAAKLAPHGYDPKLDIPFAAERFQLIHG